MKEIIERLWLYCKRGNQPERLKQLIIQASPQITEENYSLANTMAAELILSTAARALGTTYERAYIRMKLALKLNQEELNCVQDMVSAGYHQKDSWTAAFVCNLREKAAKDLGLDPLTPFQSL